MLPNSTDKKVIVESIKKLINCVSDQHEAQIQIFRQLEFEHLDNLIQYMHDDNQCTHEFEQDLRRVALLLLCELLYNNSITKNRLSKKFDISPKYGRIALNQIPQDILEFPETLKRSIELMKQPIVAGEDNYFCWVINFEKKNIGIEFIRYQKFSAFTFLDPKKCIVGITIKSYLQSFKSKTIRIKTGIQEQSPRRYSEHNSPMSRSFHKKGNQIFQQYKKNSKKYKETLATSSHQKEQSYIKTRNKIQEISQYARNSYGAEDKDKVKMYKYRRPIIDGDVGDRRSKSKGRNSQINSITSRSKERNSNSRDQRQERAKSSEKFFDRIKKLLKQ